MTAQEQIKQMLIDNDERLCGFYYEDVVSSDYDSIVSILKQSIDAYEKTSLCDYDDDCNEVPIGTYEDKMKALADYLRHVANTIEADIKET